MLKRKMEDIRNKLNYMMSLDDRNETELLKVSQELDGITVKYMKEERNYMEKECLLNADEYKLYEILEKANVFKMMYDTIRVVDPVRKKVIESVQNRPVCCEFSCYDFWKRNELCENCISMRSYYQDSIFMKIENVDNSYYLITSIPVLINNKKLVVELLKDISEKLFISDNQSFFGNDIVSFAKRLNYSAIRDSLTGAYNREYINERLPIEILRSVQEGLPLSLIFADLDYFKRVNDTYGHVAGDKVLQGAVDVFLNCIRKDRDWVARYGGEEFLICLSNTELIDAKLIAERMRKGIEDKEFVSAEAVIRVTSSFGVYMHNGEKEESMMSIISKLDKKLYMAKNEGRNRVV